MYKAGNFSINRWRKDTAFVHVLPFCFLLSTFNFCCRRVLEGAKAFAWNMTNLTTWLICYIATSHHRNIKWILPHSSIIFLSRFRPATFRFIVQTQHNALFICKCKIGCDCGAIYSCSNSFPLFDVHRYLWWEKFICDFT